MTSDHCQIIKNFFKLLLVYIVAFCIYLLVISYQLNPSKPHFILQDATISSFNVSGNPLSFLNFSFQVTISSRNPNGNSVIYYDRLDVYASYQNQKITLMTSIPYFFQGHKEVNVWSLLLIPKNSVLVGPFNDKEEALMVHIDGRVRWKSTAGGFYDNGTYDPYVRCPANISYWDRDAGVDVGNNLVKHTLNTACSVSVDE